MYQRTSTLRSENSNGSRKSSSSSKNSSRSRSSRESSVSNSRDPRPSSPKTSSTAAHFAPSAPATQDDDDGVTLVSLFVLLHLLFNYFYAKVSDSDLLLDESGMIICRSWKRTRSITKKLERFVKFLIFRSFCLFLFILATVGTCNNNKSSRGQFRFAR